MIDYEYLRKVRPVRARAFLTLAFEPGEAAQVDRGYAGLIQIGQTRCRLSFVRVRPLRSLSHFSQT